LGRDGCKKNIALVFGKEFGVIQTIEKQTSRKNDGGSDNWPG
jgi:hypothetical protein